MRVKKAFMQNNKPTKQSISYTDSHITCCFSEIKKKKRSIFTLDKDRILEIGYRGSSALQGNRKGESLQQRNFAVTVGKHKATAFYQIAIIANHQQ